MFKRSLLLAIFLTLVFYLMKWFRPIEIMIGAVVAMMVMFFLYKRFSEDNGDEEEDYIDDDEPEDEGWGAPILQTGILAILMCLAFWGVFTKVLPPAPAKAGEDPEVTHRREMTLQKIDTYTDAGSYRKAVDTINSFINTGIRNGEISGVQKNRLFAKKVKILIAWSDSERNIKKRMELLDQAGELDRRYKTGNNELIREKVRNIQLANRDESIELPESYRLKVHSAVIADSSPVKIEMILSVLGDKGTPLKSLRDKDFKARVDGDECEVELSRIQPSRNIVILQDISGSMKQEHIDKARMGIKAAFDNLNKTDKFCLVAFSDKPNTACNWTAKAATLDRAYRNLKTKGNTAIYDSIHYGLKELKRWESGQNYIVMLTDGTDSSSGKSLKQTIKKLKSAKVPVIIIALKTSEFNSSPLKKLAACSGGQYFETRDITKLSSLFQNATKLMENRYTIHLKPTTIKATCKHEVSLTVGRNLKGSKIIRF